MEIRKNQSVYHSESGIVASSFSGHYSSRDFQSICLHTISLLEKHQATKVLVDNSELEMISTENRVWIQQLWFPKAIKAGLSRMAFIMPDNIFGKVATVHANRYAAEQQLQIQYFSCRQQAMNWLMA